MVVVFLGRHTVVCVVRSGRVVVSVVAMVVVVVIRPQGGFGPSMNVVDRAVHERCRVVGVDIFCKKEKKENNWI